MKFTAIEKQPWGNYQVDIPLKDLKHTIDRYINGMVSPLILDPDFQRGHVWTLMQKTKYLEHLLSGGKGSRTIIFNCAGWMHDFRGPFVIVDGKQRLTACLEYLDDEVPAFGHYYYQMEDRLPSLITLQFAINNLSDYNDVLKWYLLLNSGGTPHSNDELDRVRKMIKN